MMTGKRNKERKGIVEGKHKCLEPVKLAEEVYGKKPSSLAILQT